MTTSYPRIGVMILNRDGRDWLPPLYESLRRQNYPNLKVYLVDNASADDSVALTLERHPEVKVLRFSENLGFCVAYNRAMPQAFADDCSWVVWANNDVLLQPGCLFELARITQAHADIGVIGPAFYAWTHNGPNAYMTGNHPGIVPGGAEGQPDAVDVAWVEGSFLMVSAACVADAGWLDPYLFFYWEEADFCRRARRKNWRVVLAPRALARHFAGGWSAGHQANADAANALKARNQYIYVLADPNRPFAVNLFNGLHLFLVLCKAAAANSFAAVAREVKTLARVLAELGSVYSKWRRDRNGQLPLATSPRYANATLDIVASPKTG